MPKEMSAGSSATIVRQSVGSFLSARVWASAWCNLTIHRCSAGLHGSYHRAGILGETHLENTKNCLAITECHLGSRYGRT